MKKETGVLLAGAVGLLAAVGFFILKRMLSNRDYHDEYHDYHRHFCRKNHRNEEHHGVEYLSMM